MNMGLGKFVKKTINVVGTAAKVGVELGADAVGARKNIKTWERNLVLILRVVQVK